EVPRWRWLLGLLLLVPIALTVVFAVYRQGHAQRRQQAELAEAEAELAAAQVEAQRLDGPWRIEEIDSRRENVPDDENSARILIAVGNRIPPRWPAWEQVPPPSNLRLDMPPGMPPLRPAPPAPLLHQRTVADLPPPNLLSSAQLEQMKAEM